MVKCVTKGLYVRFGHVKGYALGMKACKEVSYTNSTYLSMYLVAKYMRLPNFWKTPKMYKPLGILSGDPMAPL